MINFCMKSVHSLLGFPTTTTTSCKDNGTVLLQTPLRRHCRNIPSSADGLGFITFSNDFLGSPNVLESSTVKSPPPSPTTTTTTAAAAAATASTVKKYFGGIGFLDEVGGCVDGLTSCTESLGFESSDERRVDGQLENLNVDELGFRTTTTRVRSKWKKTTAEKISEVKQFPPPLSSLNEYGKPNFYLWPVRKDGRLELKEVKIDRQEVFHASRQDGRLRLHLIKDVIEFEDHLQEEDEEKVEETIFEEGEESEEEEEEEKTNGNTWLLPVTNGSGDGFRRCHELANHHHHHHHNRLHNLHAWNQHCVTIR